jgi:hypothetical protein
MDEKAELMEELEQELQWVQYRMKMLDLMEGMLFQMREIAETANQGNHTTEELDAMNERLNNLAAQVRAINEESRKIKMGKY